jgi:hypothetical protein
MIELARESCGPYRSRAQELTRAVHCTARVRHIPPVNLEGVSENQDDAGRFGRISKRAKALGSCSAVLPQVSNIASTKMHGSSATTASTNVTFPKRKPKRFSDVAMVAELVRRESLNRGPSYLDCAEGHLGCPVIAQTSS